MSALQLSAAINNLIGNPSETPAKTGDNSGKKGGGDQFSSLLDVVGNVTDPNANSSHKDDQKDPVAAAVDSPAPFRDNAKPAAKSTRNNDVEKTEKPEAPEVRAKNTNNNKDDKKVENISFRAPARENKAVEKTAAPAAKASESAAVTETDAAGEGEEKTADPVDNASILMNIIAQLLAGDQADAQNSETRPITDTPENISALFTLPPGKKIEDVFAAFADLKDTLSQLSQLMQQANAQNTPLTDEQTATLSAINNALSADLSALKDLFPQGINKEARDTLFAQFQQTGLNTATTDQIVNSEDNDLKSLLENDIHLIRDALAKYKSANEQLKITTTHTQTTQVTANININQSTPRNDSSDKPSAFTTVVAAATAEQTANTQPQAANNNNILSASASIQTSSHSGTDTNAGGNNSQGQGGGQQFAVGATNAASVKTASTANAPQFSNLLNRADQTPVPEQIAFQVKTGIANGHSKISIQLHPEDLGKLDITLDVDAKGKTGVTITADNKQTLDLLQRDSQALQKALADAGLKADSNSLNFNLRGGEREGQGQNQSQAANQYRKGQPDEPEEMNIAAVTRNYIINMSPEGLNIKI